MSKTHDIAIVWFRRDLRLADNPALQAALDAADSIIPLYIDDRESDDSWRQGEASDWWLHHSLASLTDALLNVGATLTIRQGDALDTLRQLINTTGATAVFWNRLYEPFAIARDKAVKQVLKNDGIAAESLNGSLLIEPWEITTKTETPYRVFTPYWREAQKRLSLGSALPAPSEIKCPAGIDSLPLDHLDLLPTIRWDTGIAAAWTPGEAAAREKAFAFVDEPVRHYDERRDLPGVAGTSSLSPHLHFGEISSREVFLAVQDTHDKDDEGSRIFLTELGWREFSHHIMFHYPHTTDAPMNEKYSKFPWADNVDAKVHAWQRGRTGIPIVDAGMRQLWQTGWMHNRVRMIVASFLVKNIRAHWLHGARWFWDTLVDADLPANSMGWQWSAGSGADAAPYFRIFNPVSQGEKFDKNGDYVRHYVPELARLPDKFLHKPWQLPDMLAQQLDFKIGDDYPEPIVDLAESRKAALDAFQRLKELT
ncbi:MAG: deoxyribodipyrimidine photo-lyase [Pseudomonadota bacterium]